MYYIMVVVKNEGVPLKYDTSVDYRWFVAVIIIIAGYNRQMMDDMYNKLCFELY